jgi:hypothetical protein
MAAQRDLPDASGRRPCGPWHQGVAGALIHQSLFLHAALRI